MGNKVKEIEVNKLTLYYCLHFRLTNIIGYNNIVERKKLFGMLGCQFHIPKDKRKKVLKEMEQFGMLERIDRDNFKVLDNNVDYVEEE